MKAKGYRLLTLSLAIFIAYVFAGCDQIQDILKPPVKPPPEISVSPNNGPFIPADLDVNQQALLVAQQSLSAGETTEYFSQLDALNSLLERLGEEKPPGPGMRAAPPRMPLRGRLSAQRAVELSRPAPVTIVGDINQTIDGITFTGASSISGNMVAAQLKGVSTDGTNISIEQKYSNNPDDFTYHISVSGTLVQDGLNMSYDITSDYDSGGNGSSAFNFKVLDGADKTAYDMQLIAGDNGLVLRCAEAVTRSDGFWTVTNFEGMLDTNIQSVAVGDFNFEASNDYSGSFTLSLDGAANGIVKDASGKTIASLSVNPLGDATITYADGSGQNIIKL